ncbi:MAG: hypothetical protein ACTIL2_14800 [Corynebacterium sp.]|uniref:hypothetical protein n=1 Tax=Corynebacterium sp. TaxID=1720 RepID=UPI003F95D1AB
MHPDHETIVDAAESWLSPTVRSWAPRGDARPAVRTWLAPELDRLDNVDFGTQLRDAVPLDVADPLLWANRIVPLTGGHWACAGVRFRNRDLDKCFVDVIATSLPQEPSSLDALADVLAFFDAFHPRCLRVYAASPGMFPGAPVDILIVGAPVGQQLEEPVAASYEEVVLSPTSAPDAAVRVAGIYRDIGERTPDLNWWAQPSDEDALQDAADDGLLFTVRFRGRDAGIVAVRAEDSYGLTGWVVEEKCIAPEFQGHHISAAAMQQVLRRLPDTRNAVLWGHINAGNVPSLRTAEATGRKVVGAHLWFSPDGDPRMEG